MTRPASATTLARGGALLGLACVVVAIGLVVAVAAGFRPILAADLARGVAGGAAFGGLGGLVVLRRPRLVVGWLMLLVGASNIVAVAADTWATVALVHEAGTLPGGSTAYWLSSWTWAPGYLVPVTLLLLLFPTGRPPSPRWRPVVWWTGLTIVVATVGWALAPYDEQDLAPDPAFGPVDSPLHVDGAGAVVDAALPAFLLAAVLCLASLAVRWRRSARAERAQLVWVLVAAAGVLVTFLVAMTLPALGPVLLVAAMVPLPAAVALAVLRQGLWQLDVLLGRTMTYAGLTLAILVAYAGVVSAAGLALGDLTDGERLVALVAVAVLVQPVHGWLQRGVNRMLYADRDEPWAAVDRLAASLEAINHDALATVVETVTRALRLPWAAIDAPGHARVQHGTPGAVRTSTPLVHQGRDVGLLWVSPRAGETGLGAREQQLLERLARQAAMATHASALQQDLQRSREQLVLNREEERRRLRRDLHDGLGPVLSAAAMKLEAAGDLVESDPTRARAMLTRAEQALRTSVADVRRIVDDLRPPSLDGLGLVGALRETLDQFGGSPVALELRVDESTDRAFPAAVEVAAYRITAEALTNAVRHADPGCVVVSLDVADGHLVVTVRDDGRGIGPDVDLGVGLGSMHERAAELGGSCTLDSGPGGTTVTARLPLGEP